MNMPFAGPQGDVLRKVGDDTFEVRTELTVCLVSMERDAHGEFYVDLPANWSHTQEEGCEARHLARLTMKHYLASFLPSIRNAPCAVCGRTMKDHSAEDMDRCAQDA